ncbi:MAG: hypothetical protein AUG00_06540 [Candidatus Rokubacteria bacterium 13_1_20CM_2_70_7]|nr:MAG: hypothetical protein AUG00_06540 [Candidatus Rokubacteria bacterium 13_1_20CM_2_70_7]
MTPKDVMTMEEASGYLAMDEATLTRLATQRQIPCLEVNGSWVFSKKSIDKWRSQRDRRRA